MRKRLVISSVNRAVKRKKNREKETQHEQRDDSIPLSPPSLSRIRYDRSKSHQPRD